MVAEIDDGVTVGVAWSGLNGGFSTAKAGDEIAAHSSKPAIWPRPLIRKARAYRRTWSLEVWGRDMVHLVRLFCHCARR
jgi:hypothetical protein